MTYEVIKTSAFEADLDDALAYMVEVLASPRAASDLLKAVEHVIGLLGSMPCMRAVSRKPVFLRQGIREYFLKGYVIAYRIEGERVWLLRLFHQMQQYERFVIEW